MSELEKQEVEQNSFEPEDVTSALPEGYVPGQQYAPPVNHENAARKEAILALVLACVGIVFLTLPLLGMVLPIIGIVLGKHARRELRGGDGHWMAQTALVMSIVLLVLHIVLWTFALLSALIFVSNGGLNQIAQMMPQ